MRRKSLGEKMNIKDEVTFQFSALEQDINDFKEEICEIYDVEILKSKILKFKILSNTQAIYSDLIINFNMEIEDEEINNYLIYLTNEILDRFNIE